MFAMQVLVNSLIYITVRVRSITCSSICGKIGRFVLLGIIIIAISSYSDRSFTLTTSTRNKHINISNITTSVTVRNLHIHERYFTVFSPICCTRCYSYNWKFF